jgi:hypothetical protein
MIGKRFGFLKIEMIDVRKYAAQLAKFKKIQKSRNI